MEKKNTVAVVEEITSGQEDYVAGYDTSTPDPMTPVDQPVPDFDTDESPKKNKSVRRKLSFFSDSSDDESEKKHKSKKSKKNKEERIPYDIEQHRSKKYTHAIVTPKQITPSGFYCLDTDKPINIVRPGAWPQWVGDPVTYGDVLYFNCALFKCNHGKPCDIDIPENSRPPNEDEVRAIEQVKKKKVELLKQPSSEKTPSNKRVQFSDDGNTITLLKKKLKKKKKVESEETE